MNASIKRNGNVWLLLCAMGAFSFALSAQAASFDCAKAQSKVEHLICDNAEISKLDEELNTAYKAALRDGIQADSIKQAQKQWLKVRNGCTDAGCVKRVYEVRLSILASYGSENVQQDSSAMSEKTKGEVVSKILLGSEVKLKPGSYENDSEHFQFCSKFLDDFEQQRNIEYVEPKFRTNNYNHPELAKLRNQCPNPSIPWAWSAPKICDAESLAYWLKGYEADKEAARQKADEMCATLFGTDELALYEIDFGGHKEHVIYQSRSPRITHDELDQLLRKPSKKELWADHGAWNRRTNTVMNIFFSGAGYSAYDFSKCETGSIGSLAAGGVTSSYSFQGLVRYSGRYVVYNLMHYGDETRKYMVNRSRQDVEYGLIVGGRNPVCHFNVIQAKSTNRGGAK